MAEFEKKVRDVLSANNCRFIRHGKWFEEQYPEYDSKGPGSWKVKNILKIFSPKSGT